MSRLCRFLRARFLALPILLVPVLSAQVAKPVGTKVSMDFTAPAPRLSSIGGSPTTTLLTWEAAPTGARLRQFEVSRWHQASLTCCNASVVIPASQSSDAKWIDYDFPLSGIYVYRITSAYADGTRGTVQVDYTRPEPVNPASLAAVQTGYQTVQLTWPEVPEASFYQVWGQGIASTGMTVVNEVIPAQTVTLFPGVTQQIVGGVRHFVLSLSGIPVGPQSWSIGSFYQPPICPSAPAGQPCQKVSTAGTAFTQGSVNMLALRRPPPEE